MVRVSIECTSLKNDGWSMMVKEKENKLHKSKKSLQQKKKEDGERKENFWVSSSFGFCDDEHRT